MSEIYAIATTKDGLKTFYTGTVPDGAVAVSEQDWAAAHDVAVAHAAEAAKASLPRLTYKADIWRRCTDDQADALDTLLKAQSARQQRIFDDAVVIDHADPLFAALHDAITRAFDAAAADAILAPSQG